MKARETRLKRRQPDNMAVKTENKLALDSKTTQQKERRSLAKRQQAKQAVAFSSQMGLVASLIQLNAQNIFVTT